MQPPSPTKKFRRGQRVRIQRANPKCQGSGYNNGRLGTVINADAGMWGNSRQVSVRMDSQQPWERGWQMAEDDLVPDTSGATEFELRHYEIRWMTHAVVAELRLAVEQSQLPDERKEALLKSTLPTLPS